MKRLMFFIAIALAAAAISSCSSDRTMCGKVHSQYVGYGHK